MIFMRSLTIFRKKLIITFTKILENTPVSLLCLVKGVKNNNTECGLAQEINPNSNCSNGLY